MKAWFKNLFIPSKANSYAPQALQKAAVVGMFALILLSFTLTNVQSLIWLASDWMVSTILPAVIVHETNDERASDALPALRRNATLDAAAKLKAEHMAKNEYFAHYSPDGVSPWYWFGQVDYNFVHAGENLAIHFSDSGEVVDAWMNSPTHRANIMNGDYVEIGVGTAEGSYEGFSTVYVVQLFGTPAAAAGAVAGAEVAALPVLAAQPEVTDEVTMATEVAEVAKPTSAPVEEEVLADEVAITETVEVIPAEPVAVAPEPEMAVTDSGVALYLDHVSTSTGGVPATIEGTPTFTEPVGPTALLTKPHLVLQLLYAIIGLFVLTALLLSVFVEIRHQQPVQIAYGFVLLALMGGLFYLHAALTTGAMVV